jgi:transcriptional regulator with XRE-family HTH domain/quercetin dioxygenase-like cupin family protein
MASEPTDLSQRSMRDIVEDDLPRRLRAAREERGISVRELARRLDVSPSAISQIETGRARPSVSTLYALVTELNMSLDELFDHVVEPRDPTRRLAGLTTPVVRRGERKVLDLGTGVHWERLTAGNDPDVDFMEVRYEAGGDSSPTGSLMRHAGREYGLVLSGQLTVAVGFETYELGPGDSISFESTLPHRLTNPGRKAATAVWVVQGRNDGSSSVS